MKATTNTVSSTARETHTSINGWLAFLAVSSGVWRKVLVITLKTVVAETAKAQRVLDGEDHPHARGGQVRIDVGSTGFDG